MAVFLHMVKLEVAKLILFLEIKVNLITGLFIRFFNKFLKQRMLKINKILWCFYNLRKFIMNKYLIY
jgi:hypothetical protein